jgi:hypothetical protein
MSRVQRIVLILYCILVVYCCLWIPWKYEAVNHAYIRLGYAWLWVGPASATVPNTTFPFPRAGGARPDMPLIALRLLAATAAGAIAFLLIGIKGKNPAARN